MQLPRPLAIAAFAVILIHAKEPALSSSLSSLFATSSLLLFALSSGTLASLLASSFSSQH